MWQPGPRAPQCRGRRRCWRPGSGLDLCPAAGRACGGRRCVKNNGSTRVIASNDAGQQCVARGVHGVAACVHGGAVLCLVLGVRCPCGCFRGHSPWRVWALLAGAWCSVRGDRCVGIGVWCSVRARGVPLPLPHSPRRSNRHTVPRQGRVLVARTVSTWSARGQHPRSARHDPLSFCPRSAHGQHGATQCRSRRKQRHSGC